MSNTTPDPKLQVIDVAVEVGQLTTEEKVAALESRVAWLEQHFATLGIHRADLPYKPAAEEGHEHIPD
jgi:hypothetical protein